MGRMATRRVHALKRQKLQKTILVAKIKGVGTLKYNIRKDPQGRRAEVLIYEKGQMQRLTIQRIKQTNFVIYKNTILIFTPRGFRRATPEEQKLFDPIMKILRKENSKIHF